MIKTTLKLFFRSFRKSPLISTINLLGLSLGLAAGLLVLIYVVDELGFDQMHTKGDRIYRVVTDVSDKESGVVESQLETNGWPVGRKLDEEYPEVEAVVYSRRSSLKILHDRKFFTEQVYYATPSFFHLFDFAAEASTASKALEEPFSAVITQSAAERYFGSQDPVGKSLTMGDTLLIRVGAVIDDIPDQSHIQFDILLSFSTYERINPDFTFDGGWGNLNVRNYLLLSEQADIDDLAAKAASMYADIGGEWLREMALEITPRFQPLKDIYLRSDYGNGFGPQGSISRVYLVIGVAVLLILLACINFINLNTARAVYRAKEIGLRKVIGSTRGGLLGQIYLESFLFTIGGSLVAIGLADLSLPILNNLLGKTYTIGILMTPELVAGSIVLLIVVSLLAGFYPARVMASMQPAEILKGEYRSGTRGKRLRQVLVVAQFVVSAGLIIANFTVSGQLEFMQNRDLGFIKENVMLISTRGIPFELRQRAHNGLTNELKAWTEVEGLTFTNSLPGRRGWIGQWAYPEGQSEEQNIPVEYVSIDEQYIQTLGLDLIAGENFNPEKVADLEEGLIVNEELIRLFGFGTPNEAIGKRIESPSGHPEGKVIGVIRDYHQAGLQERIGPIAMDYAPNYNFYYAVRFREINEQTMAKVNTLWHSYFDGYEPVTFFLDNDFDRQYRDEARIASVFNIFSYLTIFVAVIGLVGMISFMIASRRREIGVRKVLGANVIRVTSLFTREFVIMIMVANGIAIPVAYVLLSDWLQGFAYAMPVQYSHILITICITLFVTLATISYQTIKAAIVNPVDTLRQSD